MKTGRVRKKKQGPQAKPAAEPAAKPAPEPASAGSTGSKPRRAVARTDGKAPSQLLFLGIFAVIVIFIMILAVTMLSRGRTDEWVEATSANGTWTTTVSLLGPQVVVTERWETECINDPNGAVRPGSCIARETDTFQDKVVDDYEEYAYDIYYDKVWDKVYQAQGAEFSATEFGSDDYWEGNLHYVREEELDRDGCEYSEYTLWVDDRQDSSQEVEVYLAECEVWDHVTVSERVYERGQWCGCEVTTLVPLGSDVNQGMSSSVSWPEARIPPGGDSKRSFSGTVLFEGDGYTFHATTEDMAQYMDYLTGQYYIGVRDGRPVSVSKSPP